MKYDKSDEKTAESMDEANDQVKTEEAKPNLPEDYMFTVSF